MKPHQKEIIRLINYSQNKRFIRSSRGSAKGFYINESSYVLRILNTTTYKFITIKEYGVVNYIIKRSKDGKRVSRNTLLTLIELMKAVILLDSPDDRFMNPDEWTNTTHDGIIHEIQKLTNFTNERGNGPYTLIR